MTKTYGGIMIGRALNVLRSDASEADQNMAEYAKPIIEHMIDIASAYRKYTPTEVLVYGSDNGKNIEEAIRCLFQEDDPAASFGSMMERADKRLDCAGGTQAAGRWHSLFRELQAMETNETNEQDSEAKTLKLSEFAKYRTVAGYLAYNAGNGQK
jgi:hypothetical protein